MQLKRDTRWEINFRFIKYYRLNLKKKNDSRSTSK